MSRVVVKIPAWLTRGANTESVGFDNRCMTAVNVSEVIDTLHRSYPGSRAFQEMLSHRTFAVILNGRYLDPHSSYETELKEHDEITLLPLMDGG